MRINFKQLHFENFLSFSNATLKFDSKGYTLVCGKNENPVDNAVSNGAGKSAIFESIIWCLTGETVRGSKDVKNIFTEGTVKVELEFTIDKNDYKLIRTKDPSNLFLYVNSENKSGKGIRDTSEIVAEYLPDITSQLLGSVIVLGQGLPHRFTNNTPSGRKEVLEKLFKTDFMIMDIKNKISDRSAILYTQKRKLEDAILADNSKKDILQQQLIKAQEELTYYENLDTESSKQQISQLETEINDHQRIIDEQSAEMESLNTKLNEGLNFYSDLNSQFNDAVNKVNSSHTIEDSTFKDTTAQQKADIRSLEAEIQRLKNIKDTCPTCGHKLEGVEKPDTSKQEQILKNLKERYEEQSKKYQEFKDRLENEKKVITEEFNTKLTDTRKQNSSYQAQIQIINRNLIGLKNEQSELDKEKNKLEVTLTSLTNKIESLTQSITETQQNIDDLDTNIIYNNTERDTLQDHIDVISKMNTLSTRDFRGYLLSDIIAHIDKQAKEYSKIIFNNTALDFSLDGNNLNVKFDNKDYENLSGGEKQKVDIIIQFAIREELCKNLGFSCNCIILDEIFDNLDFDGCEKVLNLISHELVDVDNIFVVTHHNDISIPADSTIFVVKGVDKISRLV